MDTMVSPLAMALLMGFFVLVAGGAYLAVRILGAHAVDSDHPHTRYRRHRR